MKAHRLKERLINSHLSTEFVKDQKTRLEAIPEARYTVEEEEQREP